MRGRTGVGSDTHSPSERAELRHLTRGQTDEQELARRAELPLEGAHSLLVTLAQVGLVRRAGGGYQLGDEFLKNWLHSGAVQEHEVRLSDQASIEISDQTQVR